MRWAAAALIAGAVAAESPLAAWLDESAHSAATAAARRAAYEATLADDASALRFAVSSDDIARLGPIGKAYSWARAPNVHL